MDSTRFKDRVFLISGAARGIGRALATRVVADADLLAEARAQAAALAQGPTLAYGRVKALLTSTFGAGLETQMEFESLAISGMAKTADGREGIAAFLDKRTPAFKGE